jgi:hypothetical protein
MNQEQEISNGQEELLKHEQVLIEYLSIIMNKDFESLDKLFHSKVITELVFMIDQEVFSDLIVREHNLEEVLVSLKDFLSNKGVPFEMNLEPLMNEQRKERINFLIDLIVMVKIFNLNQFTYYESLFEPEFKIFFNEMILYSEDQLKGRLDNGTQAKTIQGFSHQEMQKEMQEKLLLREEILALEAERDKVVLKNNDLEDEIIAVRVELRKQVERYTLLEEAVLEKNKEYLEEFDRREEIHEQMKRYELDLKGYKEACARYAVEEENFEKLMQKKDKKIKKYLREIEEHEKTINIYELQMKEFARITQQYKNEKDDFLRRKEIVSILKQNNHDKNQMLYYFSHKNYQLGVEKQKLDQYIKLCQYQIQKLTSENKNLKHENEVLKTLNQNLMELGGPSRPNGAVGETPGGQYSAKFVTILKDNIKVKVKRCCKSRWIA